MYKIHMRGKMKTIPDQCGITINESNETMIIPTTVLNSRA
jgi:hypothetical protein